MNHVDASHHLEQLACHMRSGPTAGRCHAELPRMGFRIGDELRDRLGRKRWSDLKRESRAADARHRRDIADEIVVELFVQRRVDRALNRDQEERIPVAGALTTASMAMLPRRRPAGSRQ